MRAWSKAVQKEISKYSDEQLDEYIRWCAGMIVVGYRNHPHMRIALRVWRKRQKRCYKA